MRKVMFALAIVAGAFMTAGPASAQCRYIMNDVGRFHGYLSGPCNGAALGYGGAYPYHPNAPAGFHPTVNAPKVISQVNGHAGGCDSLCQAKCQATWRALINKRGYFCILVSSLASKLFGWYPFIPLLPPIRLKFANKILHTHSWI